MARSAASPTARRSASVSAGSGKRAAGTRLALTRAAVKERIARRGLAEADDLRACVPQGVRELLVLGRHAPQPGLEVQDALLETARFWLDRGVDGLRLDVANFYVHDAQLRGLDG